MGRLRRLRSSRLHRMLRSRLRSLFGWRQGRRLHSRLGDESLRLVKSLNFVQRFFRKFFHRTESI